MGTFGKVKKYSKPSLSVEIEEKAKFLEKELLKTNALSEQPANNTSDVYSTISYEQSYKEKLQDITTNASGEEVSVHYGDTEGQELGYSPDGSVRATRFAGYGQWDADPNAIWYKTDNGWNYLSYGQPSRAYDTWPSPPGTTMTDDNGETTGGWGAWVSTAFAGAAVRCDQDSRGQSIPSNIVNATKSANGGGLTVEEFAESPTKVITQVSLDDADYFPGNPARFLASLLDTATQGIDYLKSKAEVVDRALDQVAARMNALGAKKTLDWYSGYLKDKNKNKVGSTRDNPKNISGLIKGGESTLEKWYEENKEFFDVPGGLDLAVAALQSAIDTDSTLNNVLGTFDLPRGDGIEVDKKNGILRIKKAYDFDGILDMRGGDWKTTLGAIPYGYMKGIPLHMKGWDVRDPYRSGVTEPAYMEVEIDMSTGKVKTSKKKLLAKESTEQKWFNKKDVKPDYPDKAPPKMIDGWHPKLHKKFYPSVKDPVLKISKKDLNRQHLFKDDEIKEFTEMVDNINQLLDMQPELLPYVQQRYPANDTRLAALNYKMDIMLEAGKEYVDKHFPVNKTLFKRATESIKKNIELTDPKHFEKVKEAPKYIHLKKYDLSKITETVSRHFKNKKFHYKSWHKGHLSDA